MKAVTQLVRGVGVGAIVCLSGCASIISGRHADVTFYSNVPNASVVIHDKHGNEIANTTTPATVALKRKDRIIYPAKYTATIMAPGYDSAQVPIDSTINPWVFGNVVFAYGGLVGLAVDNVTGAAWAPKESHIYQELTPTLTAENSQPAPTSTPVSYLSATPTPLPAALSSAQPVVHVASQPTEGCPELLAPAAPKPSAPQEAGALPTGLY